MADKDKLRQQVFGVLLRNAIFSWQVAFTVVFTALLYFFVPISLPFWQNWFWLIGGALATLGFVGATLTDPQAAQEAMTREFERQYDLSRIKSRVSRDRLRDALEYRRNMLVLAKRASGSLRTSLLYTVNDVNDWIAHMYDLAEHIDAYDSNELVRRDREQVPEQIRKTEQRLEAERRRDPSSSVARDLENQLERLHQQRANLEAAFNGARRAEIQLESTLSALGTIYAQMANLGTREVDSARAQRLRLEIQDEVSSLQDTIEAMDEVQAQTLRRR